MNTSILHIAATSILAAVLICPAISRAEKPPTTAPGTPTTNPDESGVTKFYGTISAVDTKAMTFTIDNQTFTVVAETDCEIALCFSRAEEKFPARLITPGEVEVEIRGGANATRQINHILKPEFPAQRLLLVEVYTPSGNWSSYPPHKHDVHSPPEEVDLEEIYYYKIDRPEGYAIQRVYTPDGRIDQTLTVRDGELVLIPEGYHPVVAAHGYNVYYLNALAGSARSMAASDDPAYAWVRQSWTEKDPRVPLVKGVKETA